MKTQKICEQNKTFCNDFKIEEAVWDLQIMYSKNFGSFIIQLF